MYDYFSDYARRDEYRELLDGKFAWGGADFRMGRRCGCCRIRSGMCAGCIFNKLRCDEAELFREDVFKAAQFVTKSREGIRGAMEVFSTMHQPYGVMQRLIDGAAESQLRVFRVVCVGGD